MSDPFEYELKCLINKYSKNNSNTPDYLLADYLNKCLQVFNETVNNREIWYGRKEIQIEPD